MKTIADFKRTMIVGSQWIFTAHWHSNPIIRECKQTDNVGFGLKHPTQEKISYCNWPKKAEVVELGTNYILLRGEGFPNHHFLRYEVI